MNLAPAHKSRPNILAERLIIIGDVHFGIGANDEYFFNSMITYFTEIVIPWLESNLQPTDFILFTGDIFDNDSSIRIEVYDAACAIIEKMARLAPVCIICGNHDVAKKNSNDVNSLRGIGQNPNVYVFYEPTTWDLAFGKKLWFKPWTKDVDDVSIYKGLKDTIMLSHSHYNGLVFNDEYIKKEGGEVKSIDIRDLNELAFVINGHIHKRQVIDHILNVGSLQQFTFNDANNESGIHLVNVDDLNFKFVENNYSPKFYQSTIEEFLDIDEKKAEIEFKNKFVRITYPADMAKTFNLDQLRLLAPAINMEFVPDYSYEKYNLEKSKEVSTDIVDLQSIIRESITELELGKDYTESLTDEMNSLYKELSKTELAEI